jgi:hypothetical protein
MSEQKNPTQEKVFTKTIGAGHILVMRLQPWIRTQKGSVWLASLAVSKSRRQINDWLKRRKNARVRRLDLSLTGKIGNGVQAIGIRKLRQWMSELPKGDSISFRCEAACPDKQFQVWSRWFTRHENKDWDISEEHRAFFYYKKQV